MAIEKCPDCGQLDDRRHCPEAQACPSCAGEFCWDCERLRALPDEAVVVPVAAERKWLCVPCGGERPKRRRILATAKF